MHDIAEIKRGDVVALATKPIATSIKLENLPLYVILSPPFIIQNAQSLIILPLGAPDDFVEASITTPVITVSLYPANAPGRSKSLQRQAILMGLKIIPIPVYVNVVGYINSVEIAQLDYGLKLLLGLD